MKQKKEANSAPAALSDDALAEVSGGKKIVIESVHTGNVTPTLVEGYVSDQKCDINLCPYTDKQNCPMYASLPLCCVR